MNVYYGDRRINNFLLFFYYFYLPYLRFLKRIYFSVNALKCCEYYKKRRKKVILQKQFLQILAINIKTTRNFFHKIASGCYGSNLVPFSLYFFVIGVIIHQKKKKSNLTRFLWKGNNLFVLDPKMFLWKFFLFFHLIFQNIMRMS